MNEILTQLEKVRREFGPGSAGRRMRLLSRAARHELTDADQLLAYHELLLFALAHPDHAALRRCVEAELKRVAKAARRITREGGRRARRRLDDTGIAHSLTSCTFTFDCSTWLAERYGRDVELAWEDDSLGFALDEFLPALSSSVEEDGLVSSRYTTREWFALARGGSNRTELAWLLSLFAQLRAAGAERDRLFESFELTLRWRLSDRAASRTFQRFPARRADYQETALDRQVPDPSWLDRPLPSPRRLAIGAARGVIEVARSALGVRRSETDPMTYANPHEVMIVPLEHGHDVALIGMRPDRRRPIESFFGYMVARNRVPVAYGGGWVFLDRCEIGIHVFDTFRGGESARVFGEVLRVYRQLFKARRFTVDPYQFGADNADAIHSGAFWFYYRFGFRPVDPDLAARSEQEWERLRSDRGHRTSAALLRRFAESKLHLQVEPGDAASAPDLGAVSVAVTKWIGLTHGGDRAKAERAALARAVRVLGVNDLPAWPAAEREAFGRLSLLSALIPDLGRWPAAARRDLVSLMRAKGGRRESVYVRRMRNHGRFRLALAAMAGAEGRRKDGEEG